MRTWMSFAIKVILFVFGIVFILVNFTGCGYKRQTPIVMDYLIVCPTVKDLVKECEDLPPEIKITNLDNIAPSKKREAKVEYMYGECASKVESFIKARKACETRIEELNKIERKRSEK